MANLQKLKCLPLNRLLTRNFSLAARANALNVMVDPTPVQRVELESDLAALQAKEKGPWTELSKEEKVQLYKAQFPVTISDNLKTDDGKSVAGGVLFGVALAMGFFAFLKTYVGPTPPRTINEEWKAKNLEKRKLFRQDPITRPQP